MIIDNNFLPEEYKQEINNLLDSKEIPFYIWKHSVDYDDFPHFVHSIILDKQGRSSLEPFFTNILKLFCNKHNLNINIIFRMAINLTFNLGTVDKCPEHYDHKFEHYVFLLYLNDSDGDTVIINKDTTKTKISPTKYKAICFKGNKHYMYLPKNNIRIVNVTTFK